MPEKPTVLLIFGPGGYAFDEKDAKLAIENFKQAGADVVIVGDGKREVSMPEIIDSANKIKGELSVFVHAHGEVKVGKHCIDLSGNCDTPTSEFLSKLTKARSGKKFDMLMASCHGGAAQATADGILPKGSVFVDLAPGSQTVASADVERFLKTVAENKELAASFSGEKMLNDYLMTDLKNRIPPSVTIAGEGTYRLESILKGRLGQKFSKEEKEKIHKTLDTEFGKEKVDGIISKIETAKSEYDINAVNFGPAMAVAFAAHDRKKGGLVIPRDLKLPSMENLNGAASTRPFEEGFKASDTKVVARPTTQNGITKA